MQKEIIDFSPWAIQNKDGENRFYPEIQETFRTNFQRDRDRVIHSKAFRRLSFKTQVLTSQAGALYRTRLTHSIEVSQISRSLAIALGLNQDLVEVLALAHDLGHPPFGHAGQDTLNILMKEHGGFEHNCQSLRQVSKLEENYLEYSGLNLTKITLMSMMKHNQVYHFDLELKSLLKEKEERGMILETKLVDICDRIAYIHHDLQDALASKILCLKDIENETWWQEGWNRIEESKGKIFTQAREEIKIRTVIRFLLHTTIVDMTHTSLESLKNKISTTAKFKENQKDSRHMDMDTLLSLSKERKEILNHMYKFLYKNFYQDPSVAEMSRRGQEHIVKLFKTLIKKVQFLPSHYQSRISNDGLERTICDYIAGMTDHFVVELVRKK